MRKLKNQEIVLCMLTLSLIVFIVFMNAFLSHGEEIQTDEVTNIHVSGGTFYTQEPTSTPENKITNAKKFKKIKYCSWGKKKQWKIYKICKKYHISFEMCISQAYQESTWNEKASGDGGLAYGAWQIHPSSWRRELRRWGYSYNDMYNVYNACNAYCRIMASHFRKYDNVYFALMAWRWGGSAGMSKLTNYGADVYSRQIVSRTKKYEDM